ncbi:MAG TPA: aminotransferase class V-fold PLP-dependent enzyme [Nordella sp.]|nr:aminotransferase class V-fold PLP-dependent enzyme [Nordella sp.]
MPHQNILQKLGLRPVINVSGTMTALGASSVGPEVMAAMNDILPRFVHIDDLQRAAGRQIAATCGAEAGFVTACTGAAISLAIAATMTGADRARIARLPDTSGLARTEVAVLAGHLISYGAPVEQAIRITGARVVAAGQATSVAEYEFDAALGDQTAAALYVVSHHTAQSGMIGLRRFAEIAHAKGVPVIVDGAAEYDLTGFLSQGADLALYSAHKFLGGVTAGIVAGRRDLVQAAYLQNRGIGRGMKVGKEGIVGTIAALQAWEKRDHASQRRQESELLHLWQEALANRAGISTAISPDPTGNPVDRLRVTIAPDQAGTTAWDLAAALAAGDPSIEVRSEFLDFGCFELDPCNLRRDEAEQVARRFVELLDAARAGKLGKTSFADWCSADERKIWQP